MNKKIITGLVVLMGLSIMGIIIIQLVWVNNAIRVKNELFDRSVEEALTTGTRTLEYSRDFRFFSRPFQQDSGMRANFFRSGPPSSGGRNPGHIEIPSNPKDSGEVRMLRIIRSINSERPGPGRGESANFGQRGPRGRQTIRVNVDSLGRRLDSLYTQNIKHLDSLVNRPMFHQEFDTTMQRRFDARNNQLRRTADRVISEIYNWETEDPSVDRINEVLKLQFEFQKIEIPFEFGILKDSTITAKTELADSVLLFESPYKYRLYPDNIFQRNKLIVVYFPDKESSIYRSMSWLLIISLFFSIIVLLTFAVSVHFILRQKKISEMKSDFINNMTHEFKTPIATISVAADTITNPKIIEDPSKIRQFVEMIKKENKRMNRQVEDILTIARLDKKEFEFKWEPCDLHDIINSAIQSILIQVEKKGGNIHSELLATNPIATTDMIHFSNMIYNLLDNANKYSTEVPDIKVSTKNNSKGVIISIEDKGIGMTKAVQSRIFERFYRQTSGNIHNVKGFGLGLSYVKAVIEANRGSISVHSEPGKGSRFDVFVPFFVSE